MECLPLLGIRTVLVRGGRRGALPNVADRCFNIVINSQESLHIIADCYFSIEMTNQESLQILRIVISN